MRFCYLRIALLTSAIAANASTDTAEKDAQLAASRTTSSPPLRRDNFTASVVPETHERMSVDDEDRTHPTIVKFAQLMGKTIEDDVVHGLKIRVFDSLIGRRMTPKLAYDKMGPSSAIDNVLSDDKWTRWAFFVYQLGHQFDENGYEFLVAAMSAIYDAETFSEILITAAKAADTQPLAINLAKVADDHIKSLVLNRLPGLSGELLRQAPHTAEQVKQPRLDRIRAYLDAFGRADTLPDKDFFILTSYLSVFFHKNHVVGAGASVSREFSDSAALLQTLLSLKNYHDPRRLDNFVSMWLDVNNPPSNIVSMLMQDKATADQLTTLFSDGPSRNFWLHYLEKYNAISRDDDFTHFANANFEQLCQMLFAVIDQELPAADKYMAYSTMLKMLISPFQARLRASQDNVFNLMSVMLWDRTRPSVVLTMLMRGEEDANKFYLYFVNPSSKNFWVRYLKTYNLLSKGVEDFTDTANTDFEQLLIMLHDWKTQELSRADKYLAGSIIIKLLISPEITNVITHRNYLAEMMANWLEQRLHPSEVVKMLVLEDVKTDYFKILFMNEPSSKLWEDYTKAYYANILPYPSSIIATLVRAFRYANLKRMFTDASTVEATSEKAKALLSYLDTYSV